MQELTKKLAQEIHVPLTDSDIEICHRVQTAGNSAAPNIIVQFTRRAQRNSFLEKARKCKLTANDLALEPNNQIFVNEHLCPAMKRLFGAANAAKKAHGWKYAWVKNGKIYARKSDTAPVIPITRVDDLSKIM